jgi:hypothetical protein
MKVGFFSPLPPASTGVADYSAALLKAMQKLGDVIPNAPGDVNLYHAGNNHLHREIYARALAEPGVVVLHDSVLQHFFLGTLTEAEYVEEFVSNYGDEPLARELWKNRARSAADPRYFHYPMLKRISATSKAIIVHNAAAARLVRQHGAQRVFEIPHLFLKPHLPPTEMVTKLRAELGGTLLVGVFGHLRESKRLQVILRAMGRLKDLDVRLLIQGKFASSDLERALKDRLQQPGIIRREFLEEPDFWRYASATDLCLNLRFPSAGETSGIAISMMGIGKPVVFTSGEELAHFPGNSYLSVEPGPAEEKHLAELTRWIATNREVGLEIGRRAAAHIQKEHDPTRVASLFWEALNSTR